MTEKVEMLASCLECAENKLQHASALVNNVYSDSSKCRLFIFMCRDLPDLKTSLGTDHLTLELKCKTNADFYQGKHTERLDEFYDSYYSIMAVLDTVSCNSKSGHLSRGPTLSYSIHFSNLFETMIVNNQDLSNVV
ncbi:hypothetical protein PR048_021015 [Dryococelus australis]|uniref:Uncharacterized protein n=1 Tax=Dryococelus australis TaxID=614101 RepID=A0ABQ9GX09_9NEOP|nr:hypothetical protein PR048_021015 [Dryococelus australis]